VKEAGSPKQLFENLDLTPIHPILWTGLHTDSPRRLVEYDPEWDIKALLLHQLKQIPYVKDLVKCLMRNTYRDRTNVNEKRRAPFLQRAKVHYFFLSWQLNFFASARSSSEGKRPNLFICSSGVSLDILVSSALHSASFFLISSLIFLSFSFKGPSIYSGSVLLKYIYDSMGVNYSCM